MTLCDSDLLYPYRKSLQVAELMPPLPADGIFAVDALLPGAYIRDPVLWQWQDDRGNWDTYRYTHIWDTLDHFGDARDTFRYNDIRCIEAAFVAGEEEVSVQSGGKAFNLNLKSMHEIRYANLRINRCIILYCMVARWL